LHFGNDGEFTMSLFNSVGPIEIGIENKDKIRDVKDKILSGLRIKIDEFVKLYGPDKKRNHSD